MSKVIYVVIDWGHWSGLPHIVDGSLMVSRKMAENEAIALNGVSGSVNRYTIAEVREIEAEDGGA
jgi:hypothetical protein